MPKLQYMYYCSFLESLRQLDDNLIEEEPYNRLAQKIQRQLKWRVKI